MTEFITIVGGIITFWNEVAPFVKMLQKTPAEQRNQVIANVHAAFQKAETTQGDTSDIEKSISG